jgi:hypothetical protein
MVRQNSLGLEDLEQKDAEEEEEGEAEEEQQENSLDSKKKSVVGLSILAPPVTKKRTLIVRKGREIVTATDYRAVIAIMLVASFIFVVIRGDFTGIAALGPLAGAAVGYYFHWKGSEQL